MSKKLTERLKEQGERLFNAGFSSGEQYASDVISAAAYECGVSKSKIREIMLRATELGKELCGALETKTNPEADFCQAKLDEQLRQIYGDAFAPWEERYQYIKECRYC